MAAVTRRRKVKAPRRITKRERLEDLRLALVICFTAMDEPDAKEVANRTGLSVSTIFRLQSERLTLAVHYGTVQAVALAAGIRIEFAETGILMRLV